MNGDRRAFWKDDLPRLVAIAVAVATFIYLLYDLTVRGNGFTLTHLWILLVVVALVLGSIASRLKIFSFIDFKSEVDSLRTETRRELAGIRNQVSAMVETQTTQRQLTIMNLIQGSDSEKLAESLEKQYQTLERPQAGESKSALQPERDKFFRRVENLIRRAYGVFFIARALQIAIVSHRIPAGAGADLGTGDVEERTKHLVEVLLNEDIGVFVPANEKDNTTRKLEQILKLINIKRECDSGSEELPPYEEVDRMFDDAYDVIGDIAAGTAIFASAAIVSYGNIMSTIEELKRKFGVSPDAEQGISNQTSES